MSGQDLAAEVRRRRPDIKILFTSGFHAVGALGAGVPESEEFVLRKPYRMAELANKIAALLGKEGRTV